MVTSIAVTLPRFAAAAESGFTVTRLRGFVATALSDADLQLLLDAALQAIEDEIGPAGTASEQLTVHGDLLPLSRRAKSVSSVTENARYSPVALAANDYELSDSGRILVRLRTGTNPGWAWRDRVRVRYVPDDTAIRITTAIALVKLKINHTPGLAAQSIGTWSEQYAANSVWNYEQERQQILAALTDGAMVR